MATSERPKSRLPDGRVNPDYTAWRKANKGDVEPLPASIPYPGAGTFISLIPTESFQSAAEPEQTTIDDPREPEVAPALEALSAESIEPEILTLIALKEARNDRFVLCAHPTEKGKMVPVRLQKKIAARLLKKPINVRVEGEGEETKYFHVR